MSKNFFRPTEEVAGQTVSQLKIFISRLGLSDHAQFLHITFVHLTAWLCDVSVGKTHIVSLLTIEFPIACASDHHTRLEHRLISNSSVAVFSKLVNFYLSKRNMHVNITDCQSTD